MKMGEQNIEGVKVMEVIEVVSCEGSGKENDPSRLVTFYYSKEGELLAKKDVWKEENQA